MEQRGVSKYKALVALSERYGCPWTEYDEKIAAPLLLLYRLDLEHLKEELWFPSAVTDDRATIIACAPGPALAEKIRETLAVAAVDFLVTLPADLIRIIEHNQDINPGFSPAAGRTPLAKVRTYLAGRRSLFAHYRTLLAKSRTGLAFIRTGISFITIALLFVRAFGTGAFLLLEAPLLLVGGVMVYEGLRWYLPARRIHAALPPCTATEPSGGTTVLAVEQEESFPLFRRSLEVAGAAALRAGWTSLSPVMRRRYLASDRTDLAEERTVLACFRTRMAKARTGLAFVRTGIAFVGLGFGLFRHFPASRWLFFDLGLIGCGAFMVCEGFLWYGSGRRAGVEGYDSVQERWGMSTVWDFFFPLRHTLPNIATMPQVLPVRSSHAPGIWATTGLALERTMLAERRNVMARLRTLMARARTGFAFIRTGLSVFLIGVAFTLYFEAGGIGWPLFNGAMIATGLLLIGDGLVWSVPAERQRRQFPYCFGGMEIVVADYGTPCRFWKKVVFGGEET